MLQSIADPFVLVVTGWLTFLIALAACRIASDSRFLPDEPNHRSNHNRAISKAGGIAIAGAWVIGMMIILAFWSDAPNAIFGARLIVLAIFAFLFGIADDLWGLEAPAKFLAQILIAILFLFLFEPIQSIPLPIAGSLTLGMFGFAVTVLWIVGFMNAYNFMDGSDGLAAGSAILGLSVFAVTASISGAIYLSIALALLAIAVGGFFPRNFTQGKIFMGDCGSQTVSFLIAVFSIVALEQAEISILFVPTIFLPLLFDVAFTLVHRLRRGKNILRAHREHLYQLLIQMGWPHREVAVLYIALTAISSAVAVFMLTLTPELQWLAPVGLALGLSVWGLPIYGRAKTAALLE